MLFLNTEVHRTPWRFSQIKLRQSPHFHTKNLPAVKNYVQGGGGGVRILQICFMLISTSIKRF